MSTTDPDRNEPRGYRAGIKLITGDTIWNPVQLTLTPGQVSGTLTQLAGAESGRNVPTHHLFESQHATYFIPADKILYHVIEELA